MTRRMHRRDILTVNDAAGGKVAIDWQSFADLDGGRLRPSLALVLLPWLAVLWAVL